MIKKLRKTILTGLLGVSAFLLGAAATNVLNAGALATDGWSEVTINETYLQGETLNIPERTFTLNGVETLANVVVTYPDRTTTTNQKLTLHTAGKYTVSYTAVVDGRIYKEEESFVANYRTVSYAGENTSVNYGSHHLVSTVNGLVVRLAEKDKLLFNEVIDVSNSTLSEPLFEAFVTADAPGNLDFSKLFVQITDVTDPDNYFKVRFIHTQSSSGGPYTYILAGANGQPMTGYESAFQTVHVEGNWGASARHSFLSYYGSTSTELGQTRLSVRYDAATKEVYCGNEFVIDLDNPKYFSKLWDGFKSGKVQVSAWAEDYASSSANFVVTKVGKIDLASEIMSETTPPQITVETEYEKTAMPKAMTGVGYPVPTATAHDLYSGACDVLVDVYYNYLSNPSLMAITNGKFTPNRVGRYAIVYTAKDNMGNQAKEVLWVDAEENLELPTITVNGSLPTSQNAGTLISLPTYTVEGGSGNSVVKIYVNDGLEEKEITEKSYRFNAVGTHTFTYVATDYLERESEETLVVEVTAGDKPTFVDNVKMPEYFIAGAPYELPKLYANDYTSGKLERRLATVTVKDGNGTKVIGANEKYTPSVTNNFDEVEVIYSIDGVVYPSFFVKTVKAKDAEGVHIGNYFDLNGATLELGDKNSDVTATESNGSWRFANSLIAENMEIVLDAVPAKGEFDGWKITYVDSEDESIKIQLFIYKNGKGTTVVAGKTQFEDSAVGFASDSKSNRFKIGYANGGVVVNKANVAMNTTVDGKPFNGFPSSKMYVTCEFINATAGAGYKVVEVNGQKVNSMTIDLVAPKIVILGAKGGTLPIGARTVLPAALAGDTLDPNVTFTLTVKSPSQQIVTSVDGVRLENVDPTQQYEIEIKEVGQYSIYYQAQDSFSGQTTPAGYAINVDDTKGPTFEFSTEFKKTAKVGDTLMIPSYTLSDNVDETKDIVKMNSCVAPSGEVIEMGNSNSVIATVSGVYVFRVFAMDTSGNITLKQIQVTVTE